MTIHEKIIAMWVGALMFGGLVVLLFSAIALAKILSSGVLDRL